jgi:SAM-dependent methyltransferase
MNADAQPKPTQKQKQKPDYGIDAPGVRRGMLIAGLGGAVLAAIATGAQGFGLVGAGTASIVATVLTALGLPAAAYGFYMGGYMTYGSRIGKLRTRDRLLSQVAELRPWRGSEAVLDVGCGRGLMVIGAAKRLVAGQHGLAVGIDVWRAEDQSENTPAAALENAHIEGVADRVRIDTGDARALPYADASFDVVVSHWVVHNLEPAADRLKALDEMLRVLRPGGVLALADIACFAQYREHLQARGVVQLRFLDGGLEARVMGVLSGGSYRPQALLAIRP